MKKATKKLLGALIAVAAFTTSVFSGGISAMAADVKYGDVDLNNTVDATDAAKTLEYVRNKDIGFSKEQIAAASLGLSTITATNAAMILKKAKNAEYQFPNGDIGEIDNLEKTTLFVLGDSTACYYGPTSDTNYYYKRVGFGTALPNYFKDSVTVNNLALSGRSSKSFTSETEYSTYLSSIKSGDYVLIAFGHNDEKSEDSTRYTEPNGSKETEGSFKHSLYTNYITPALQKGATPILCTSIVRRTENNTFSNSCLHITANGDYSKAIRELGEELGLTVIDNTNLTKSLYTELTPSETAYLHAWTNSKNTSVDNTHLNNYGAQYIAYLMANALKATNNPLAAYVKDGIKAPNKSALIINPDYKEVTTNDSELAENKLFNVTAPWEATVFGDIGGQAKLNNINDELTTTGGITNFEISGETNPTDTTVDSIKIRVGFPENNTAFGKIAGSSDGLAMYFKKGVDANSNFEISATATVNSFPTSYNSQVGFGVIVADTVLINENNKITVPYVAAGVKTSASTTVENPNPPSIFGFQRADGSLSTFSTDGEAPFNGMSINLKIVKVGNTYTLTVGDKTFTTTADYTDLVFPGVFVSRCADVTFTNIKFNNEVVE